nr:PH-interacting protein [Tanacetum cinerariifolium]
CRYIPQLGDQVIYLRQGHQEYIESRNSQERGPWMKYKEKIKDAEICLVDDIKYKTLPGSGESCCKIRLIFIDPLSKVSGKHFELTLPELVDDPDFLVEKTRYDSSLERDWSPGDRCSVWWNEEGGGCWWDGRIVSISDKSADFPGSQWERFNVEYDADDVHRHSHWELHDKDTEWEQTQAQHSIDFDTRKTMLSLFAKLDQSTRGNHDKLGIMKLRQTSERPDFINTFPVPLTLEIIELRIKNSYYRTFQAMNHDVKVMLSNARDYFAKHAKNADMSEKMSRLSDWFERKLSKL